MAGKKKDVPALFEIFTDSQKTETPDSQKKTKWWQNVKIPVKSQSAFTDTVDTERLKKELEKSKVEECITKENIVVEVKQTDVKQELPAQEVKETDTKKETISETTTTETPKEKTDVQPSETYEKPVVQEISEKIEEKIQEQKFELPVVFEEKNSQGTEIKTPQKPSIYPTFDRTSEIKEPVIILKLKVVVLIVLTIILAIFVAYVIGYNVGESRGRANRTEQETSPKTPLNLPKFFVILSSHKDKRTAQNQLEVFIKSNLLEKKSLEVKHGEDTWYVVYEKFCNEIDAKKFIDNNKNIWAKLKISPVIGKLAE